jgi:hypothetical protein
VLSNQAILGDHEVFCFAQRFLKRLGGFEG